MLRVGAASLILNIVPVLHGDFLATDLCALLRVHFDAGCNSAAPVVGRQETQIGLVMAALDFERGHFDLLDQLALIGVHGVKPVDHVMLVHVGSGITQRSEEHTSELQSLMRNSYAVFCLTTKNIHNTKHTTN